MTDVAVYLGDLELISLKPKHFNALQCKATRDAFFYWSSMLELREHITDEIEEKKSELGEQDGGLCSR